MQSSDLRREAAARLRIEYPAELPVSAKVREISDAWQNSNIIIVCGETGSGKTTQLPKIALASGCGINGMIGCTQPRRIAAAAMARRLAQELHGTYGKEIGSQVRFEDRTSPETVLKFMTDGILLAELHRDPLFRRYDCIIIDEAHERTLNIDFLLGLLREISAQRKDLKIAISSATMDAGRFSEFFGNVPVISVEGRTYPVEDIFLPPFEDEELAPHVARAVDELSGFDKWGDILVFLPGEREIRECAELLSGRRLPNTEIMQLYSRLSGAEQQRVFKPGNQRRIILSTNVAETSLTIPRIKFCIDSGLARISRYNPRRRIQELQIEMISRASANQRRGRCGRTADGICVHLYAEEDLLRTEAYTDPEIKRSSLAGVILQMAYLHLPDIRTFPFLDPPSAQLIREGSRTLLDIQAMDNCGRITRDGRILAKLPVDPHMGKMLLEAQKRKVAEEMIVLCAGLSIPDPKERPAEKPQTADQAHAVWKDERSDYFAILNCWNSMISSGAAASNGMLRRFCKKNFLNYTRTKEWRNLAADLAESINISIPDAPFENSDYRLIHESLLCGIPRNVARLDKESRTYCGIDGKKFVIFPGSGLAKLKKLPEFIVCFALVETSRLFGRNAAVIDPIWLQRCVPHLCSASYDQEHFEASSGFVRAREKIMLGNLTVHPGRKVDFAKINPSAAREIFITDGILEGLVCGIKEVDKFNRLRTRLLDYELRIRRPGQLYDTRAAEEFFRKEIPADTASAKSLKDHLLKNRISWDFTIDDFTAGDTDFDPDDYPDFLEFAKIKFPLQYKFEPGEELDGAFLCVPESSLDLLPDRALDYPIAGYCADFAQAMLRALPKDIRRQLGGIPQCAALFADELKNNEAMRNISPAEAIADFLDEMLDIQVNPRMFDNADIPKYLQMKLAVTDGNGKWRKVLHALPDRFSKTSRISTDLPGISDFIARNWTCWQKDDAVIPQSVELPPGSGRKFYPALTAEPDGLAGKGIFLKHAEACRSHRAGVCRLFILENAQLVKLIRKGIKYSNELKLSVMLDTPPSEFSDMLIDAAIANAADTELHTVRSAEKFSLVSEHIRQHLSDTVDMMCRELEGFVSEYSEIRKFARRSADAQDDINAHLALLFAPGFLRRDAVWTDYRRYLKALKLRAGRAADAPARDIAKNGSLKKWIDRFDAASAALQDITDSDGLYDFWLLLEECRISVFAPEVKTSLRSPLAKLEEAWEKLRI